MLVPGTFNVVRFVLIPVKIFPLFSFAVLLTSNAVNPVQPSHSKLVSAVFLDTSNEVNPVQSLQYKSVSAVFLDTSN